MAILKGEFGVRYASRDDHRRLGWIFKSCASLRDAVNAADLFLAERGLECVPLEIVDYTGEVVDTVARE